MRAALVVVAVTGCGFESSLAPTTDAAGVPVVVGFAAGASVEDEASGTVMLPVILSAPSALPVMLDYQISDGSATRGLDYQGDSSSLQFFANETIKYIPITILPDDNEEGDETVLIHLRNVRGADLGVADHTITINSDILPRVYFTLLTSSGPESESAVQLNAALDIASPTEVRVDYALSGTASAADYNLTTGTIVFPAGITSRTIDLAPIDDLLDEDPEDVVVTLTNPIDVIIKPSQGVRTHTLTDDDPEPTIGFAPAGSSTEGETVTTVTLTVSLNVISGREVSVPFSAVIPPIDGATAADFTLPTSPLVFPAGTKDQTIIVTIVDDVLDEPTESFVVTLGAATNAVLDQLKASYGLAITDNDAPPEVMFDPNETDLAVAEGNAGNPRTSYKLRLSTPSGFQISVPILFTGTADRGGGATDDYTANAPITFSPGEVEKSITLDIKPDVVPELDETVIMDIPSNGSLTNVTRGTPSQRIHTIQNDDL